MVTSINQSIRLMMLATKRVIWQRYTMATRHKGHTQESVERIQRRHVRVLRCPLK